MCCHRRAEQITGWSFAILSTARFARRSPAGYRESAESWKEVLLDLQVRGLGHAPLLAIGDGAMGSWKALKQIFPSTRMQRCTVHKTANVLNKVPKSVQPQMKRMLHEIWQAPTKEAADTAFDLFEKTFEAKYESAVKCLSKDRDCLLTFFDFPAEHWCHICTTNPIESTFATIRLRHRKTMGNGTPRASATMMFKLVQNAEKKWGKLQGHQHIRELIQGVKFINGALPLKTDGLRDKRRFNECQSRRHLNRGEGN